MDKICPDCGGDGEIMDDEIELWVDCQTCDTKGTVPVDNTGRIYKCNICEKTSTWIEGWMWKDILHKGYGNSEPGWEERYITCSDECRKKGW